MGFKAREIRDSFTPTVRSAVADCLPDYAPIGVRKGSGPVVTFAWPRHPERPALTEAVYFQKGLYGANWLRVGFYVELAGRMKGGEPTTYIIGEGGMPPWRGASDQVDYADERELADWLYEHLPRVHAEADRFFQPYRHAYPALVHLLGNMVPLYKEWFDARAEGFAPAAFADLDGTNAVYFDFEQFLKDKGVHVQLHPDCNSVWHFWHGMRPTRREEYLDGEQHPCARCTNFSSRGVFVPRHDPVFGPYVDFHCSRCAR